MPRAMSPFKAPNRIHTARFQNAGRANARNAFCRVCSWLSSMIPQPVGILRRFRHVPTKRKRCPPSNILKWERYSNWSLTSLCVADAGVSIQCQ